MLKHTIKLTGPAAAGPAISIHVLRALLDILMDVAQRVLRLQVDGRSNLNGKAPWLENATDFQLVGVRSGSTLIELQASTLMAAAPEIFRQNSLWGYDAKPEDTALSLAAQAFKDATEGASESSLLDRNVLEAIMLAQRLFAYGIDSMEFKDPRMGPRPVRVTSFGLETAERLRENAPAPQRAILSGAFYPIVGSQQTFNLLLPSGQSLKGLLSSGDLSEYASLSAHQVVVEGEVRFKVSGSVSLIVADRITRAQQGDGVWGNLPEPHPRALADLKPRIPQSPGRNGMEAVFGKFECDESAEELLAALKELE